jgi:DNA-binding winged helix-turn-helix (wHTH) protein
MATISNRKSTNTLNIGTYLVTRLDSIRALLVDNKELKFTPTEYRLLLPLLTCNPVSDKELMTFLFTSRIEDDLWAREALDRHFDNVRRKFRQTHLKMSIYRVAAFGYILIPNVAHSFS